MTQKKFITMKMDDIHPYENNPRLNDDAVPDVIESIKQCGDLDPIEVDESGVILSGHTRYKALKKLGYKETEVVVYEGLTEEQKTKYRLFANKAGEKSEWDLDKLREELGMVDLGTYDWGFDVAQEIENEIDDPYSQETKIPQYKPTGVHPQLQECLDSEKTLSLIAEIDNSSVTEQEKEFLRAAACRHNIFNYRMIAEYYANSATPEMQRLMEKSALVIIDIDDAIANGFATLEADVQEAFREDYPDEG